MVIGTFTRLNHPEMAMLVSPVVSELSVPESKMKKISDHIRRMAKDEVIQNKEFVKTLKLHGLKIDDVF